MLERVLLLGRRWVWEVEGRVSSSLPRCRFRGELEACSSLLSERGVHWEEEERRLDARIGPLRIFLELRKREEEGCEVERFGLSSEILVLSRMQLWELEREGDGCFEGRETEREELEVVLIVGR